jgi:hypothetical protein
VLLLALALNDSPAAGADGDGIAPSRRALASAVEDYHEGRDEQALATLEALLEARPWEDDAAYWIARIRLEEGECEAARALVAGRSGRGQPAGRFRILEGEAAAACGDLAGGLALVEQGLAATASWDLQRRPAQMTAGLLLVALGREAEGAARLAEAGGDPALALPAALLDALPGGTGLLAVALHEAGEGALWVRYADLDWRLSLQTGLLRQAPAPVSAPEIWREAPEATRGAAAPCGRGWIWVSPGEPLSAGEAGVFRASGREVERLERTPSAASDDSPFCAGEVTGWVRRVGGHSQLILLTPEREERWLEHPVGVADARAVAGGVELALGLVVGGQPGVWLMAPGEAARPLTDTPLALSSPRWAR